MNAIDVNAVVTCYADAGALLLMTVLMLLSERFRRPEDRSLRIFRLLGLCVAAICLLSLLFHAMHRQPAAWCHVLAIACRTLWEWLVFLSAWLWTAYVACRLYGDRKIRPAVRWLYVLPFAVYTVFLAVNVFTGIIFTCAADNQFEAGPLYFFFTVIKAGYFLTSVFLVRVYDRWAEKVRFLRIAPMLVPVLLCTGAQAFLPCRTDVPGYAIGTALLYISMASEIRFLDEESGLYNRGFLAYLFDRGLNGKKDYRSALILEADGNLPACFEILRGTLHKGGDVIRMEEKKFLMFSAADSRSALQLLSTQVEEAVGEHNREDPAEPVRMTVRCRMRTGEEDVFSFLRSAVEEKNAGDPMQGVVSMISELDRLDQELKLAADIQINMLPTNFPPFPERKEFDLYASMTPAREVGGDFYDFFLTDSSHLALVIADVSGKGIPAALFMTVSKTLIKNQLMSGCDPAEAMEHVNLQLCDRNSSMMFVTVWLAVLDITTGRGLACNAGHEDPAVRRAGGDFELLRYKHSLFAGVSKKAKYQVREFELHPGDCIFVYTDGVPEASNASGEMFGTERLTAALNQNPDAGPEELIHSVHDAADRFAGGAAQFDDITMLCLKYHGAAACRQDCQKD